MDKMMNDYLNKIDRCLRPMAASERADIINEIKSQLVRRTDFRTFRESEGVGKSIFGGIDCKKQHFQPEKIWRSCSILQPCRIYRNVRAALLQRPCCSTYVQRHNCPNSRNYRIFRFYIRRGSTICILSDGDIYGTSIYSTSSICCFWNYPILSWKRSVEDYD